MNKNKGIIIDLIISFIAMIFLEFIFYFSYKLIHCPKYIYVIIIIILIPIFLGNFILSLMGKNSIGQRIVKRKCKK